MHKSGVKPWRSAVNTLRFSMTALALATLLGLTHALAARHSVWLRASAFLPFVVSPVTVAFGLLLLYPQWTASLPLLVAAYALLAYPPQVDARLVRQSMRTSTPSAFDPRAADLGFLFIAPEQGGNGPGPARI